MAFDSFGAPQFGLQDVQIATWNATDDYGAEVDVPSVQLMGTTLSQVSAQLEGDDTITATAARAIGGEVRLRFGSISIAALEIILGNTSTASGAVQDHLKISGADNMPYIGICGKALAEEGSGDTHVFIPKCKLTGDLTIAQLEYGQFAIPEATIAIVDDATYGLINVIEHSTDTAVAIPPTNIS
jgi:autotransporter translocation and assembly factor TamB